MVSSSNLLQIIGRSGLVAIIRCPQPGVATEIGRTLIASGIQCLEVALTTPDALDAISAVRQFADGGPGGGRAYVGAGTVMTAADLTAATDAGAQFVVTPSWCQAVPAAVEAGVPVLAGAFTPSEIWQAHQAGATAVKIFPASSGGPGHLKAIRDPLPQVPLLAVGGVALAQIDDYRRAGAIGVGIGSPLVGDAATGGSLDELRRRAAVFVAACRP